ncbi:hypothetical protein [Alicyclobacillus acidiphilus]|uniref:hypothetical protein n=1 Tax=Alicyclobacillus acidiphilus TaxID=182455 RepID=UPI00082C46BB|nr:hypothetical protein [Alicyclobacillus acidiphilus]
MKRLSKAWACLFALLQNKRLTTLVPGLLGAAKVATDAIGWHVITNPEINAATNVVAAAVTLVTVFISHDKTQPSGSAASTTSSEEQQPFHDGGVSNDTKEVQPTVQAQPVQPEAASDGYARPHGE